jgi:hypothetical protein
MSADVFVSYARSSSADEALRIQEALRARGIAVFLDRQDIGTAEVFPERIADGLLDSRIVLVLMDDRYFERTWCAYEFQVAVAPYRAARPNARSDNLLDHVVLALSFRNESLSAHLPPPLAQRNWPHASSVEEVADLVATRLRQTSQTLRQRLAGCEQDLAVTRLRWGGTIPPVGQLAGRPLTAIKIPRSLRDRFLGRSQELWRIFNILETGRVREASNGCAIVGTAGVGKTQLAAEYVWRYAPNHYPGGVIWIDADVDDPALENQLRDALRVFAPGEPLPAPGDRDALNGALDRHVAEAAAKSRVLWVVDNVPVPRPERRAQPLKHWCPAVNVVDLLCTSRRGKLSEPGLFEPETIVALQELSVPAAIELITHPPVLRSALKDDEWAIVVEWVGCLPLALRILRTSLDGFVEPKKVLARARGDEPAQALDDEVQTLSEDVSEPYLRGVAEALHDSYSALRGRSSLVRCAHLMSWLAPTSTQDDRVASWVSREQLGQLANRGWIDVLAGDGGHDVWRMHRIVSSFLRARSTAADEELSELVQWLARSLPGAWVELIAHADAVLNWLRKLGPAEAQSAPPALRSPLFEIAACELGNPAGHLARYQSATLLARWGEGDTLLTRLRSQLDGASLDALAGVIALLPAIATPGAAALCADLLCSPRQDVRFAAMAIAEQFAYDGRVADALVDGLLAAADRDMIFEELPDPPTETGYVEHLAIRAVGPDGKMQKVNWNHPFWRTILAEPPREALIRLVLHPNSAKVAERFGQALRSATGDEAKLQAIVRLGFVLRAMSTSVPVKIDRISRLNRMTGEIERATEVRIPSFFSASPQHYAALIDEVVHGSDETSRLAVKVSYFSQFGMAALSALVHDSLGTGNCAVALRVGESVVANFPDSVNGYWWRGLALARLQRDKQALTDLGRVLGQQPKFFDARIERCFIFSARGNFSAAKREMDLAAGTQDAFIQLARAKFYLDHDIVDEGMQAADLAIQLDPGNSAAWVTRARAHHLLNRPDNAVADARHARDLGAQDELIEQLLGTGGG